MRLTKRLLKKYDACSNGVEFAVDNKLIGLEVKHAISKAMELDHFSGCNWLLSRLLDRNNKIRYAVFAAENVIDIFENKYPGDDRPRKAIEAAKNVIENDNEENRAAYDAAANDAYAAANAAAANNDAAAANAAAAAANTAANAAAAAATNAVNFKKEIIEYGLSLLEQRR